MRWGWLPLGLVAAFAFSGARAAPPLEVYGSLPNFEMVALSPTGNRYAAIGVFGEQRRLVVFTGKHQPLLLLPLGERKASDVDFIDDDHLILWLRATQNLGSEFVQDKIETTGAVLVNVRTKALQALLVKNEVFGGIAGYYGTARVGDRTYAYASGISTGRSMSGDRVWTGNRPDLYRIDLATGVARIVGRHANGLFKRHWLVDEAGEVAATLETNASTGKWSLRGPAGELLRGEKPVEITLAGLGEKPGSIIYYREDDAGFKCCFDTAAPGQLFENKGADFVIRDPRTRRVVGYVTDADHPEAHFIEPRREARMRAARKAFPGMDVALVTIARASST